MFKLVILLRIVATALPLKTKLANMKFSNLLHATLLAASYISVEAHPHSASHQDSSAYLGLHDRHIQERVAAPALPLVASKIGDVTVLLNT